MHSIIADVCGAGRGGMHGEGKRERERERVIMVSETRISLSI